VVPPVEADAPQRRVVLAGAGRSAGAVVGHVDLVHAVELAGRMAGQHAGQARPEAGADRHDHAPLPGLGVQVEQVLDGPDAVGHRDDMAARGDGPLGHGQVAGGWRGQHHDVGRGGVGLVDRLGPVAERGDDRGPAPPVGLVHQDGLGLGVGHQVAGRSGADGTRTTDEEAHRCPLPVTAAPARSARASPRTGAECRRNPASAGRPR
jgi:hypothetical protein